MVTTSESSTPDRSLVERMSQGDDQALSALYDRHATAVYSLALSIVGDAAEAEEVVADVFLRLWQHPDRYDADRGSVTTYLLTVGRSRSLDRIRSRTRRDEAVLRARERGITEPGPEDAESPSRGVERREARELVHSALAELPEAQREALQLAYFHGLSQSEIAGELDQPLGTVKTRIRDGMNKLRQLLVPAATEARR